MARRPQANVLNTLTALVSTAFAACSGSPTQPPPAASLSCGTIVELADAYALDARVTPSDNAVTVRLGGQSDSGQGSASVEMPKPAYQRTSQEITGSCVGAGETINRSATQGADPEPNVSATANLTTGSAGVVTASLIDAGVNAGHAAGNAQFAILNPEGAVVAQYDRNMTKEASQNFGLEFTPAQSGAHTLRATWADRTGSVTKTTGFDVAQPSTVGVVYDVFNLSRSSQTNRVPLAGATVVTFVEGQDSIVSQTDANGQYSLDLPRDAQFSVRVSHPDMLSHLVSMEGELGGSVFHTANDTKEDGSEQLALFTAGSGSIDMGLLENIAVYAENPVTGEVYYSNAREAVAFYHALDKNGLTGQRAGWDDNVSIDINVSNMTDEEIAAVEHGVELMRQCVAKSQMGGLKQILEVRHVTEQPAFDVWNQNRIYMEKNAGAAFAYTNVVLNQIGNGNSVPLSEENPDAHAGRYQFITRPEDQSGFADQLATLSLIGNRGNERNLIVFENGVAKLSPVAEYLACPALSLTLKTRVR